MNQNNLHNRINLIFFIKRTLFFGVLLLILSLSLDILITNGLKKSQTFHFVDWNNIYNSKINSDIIISGNSKAWHHISPKILDSILDAKSYNLGIDGYDFVMQNAKANVYLNHNKKPRLLIQVVGNSTLNLRKDLYQSIQFKPYLNDSVISKATKKYNGFSKLDYHIPLYRYRGENSILVNSVLNIVGLGHLQKDKNKYKGFEAYDRTWDNSFQQFVKKYPKGKTFNVSEYHKNIFENFIKEQKQNNIEIVLVYSPTFYKSQQYINNRIVSFFKNVAKKYDAKFLDYSNYKFAKNKKYFYNSQHLNKAGAELFSKLLAEDIKHINFLKK